MTGPLGRRVLKFDSGFTAEGCGIALSGDEYEVSVTGFTFVLPVLPDGELEPPSSGRQKPCRGLLSRALI